MVSHTNARVPMPANVNGCVIPLRDTWRFATVDFRQRAIAITVVAHHVI